MEFFRDLCTFLQKLSAAPKSVKQRLIFNLINEFRSKNMPCFTLMRLLLPQHDRERSAYGIKEHVFAKMFIRVLCLPPTGADAVKLLNYRASRSASSGAGDFADVAYWVLKQHCGSGGKLTMEEINSALDRIASKHANHDPRGIDSELTSVLLSTSAEEFKWVIRIILKDMKLGVGHSLILDAFHPDAKEYFSVTNSLLKVCDKLNDPSLPINELAIEMFSPFNPMLSEELDIRVLDPLFAGNQQFFIETKMDGERFQIHMNQGQFKYFSRRAHEYTSNYGADAHSGMLTPLLANQIAKSVESFIIDGEMMCWNTKKGTFTTKGMDIDVKKLNSTHVHRPCFCAFDIVYLNGEVLTNKPLRERLNQLEGIITPMPGIIMFVPRTTVSKKEDVWSSLNTAIDDLEEGLIMKGGSSTYKPGARKKGGWFKIKPEYTDSLMDTLDLLIIGGSYGEGRFAGTVSHFLLGVVTADKQFWSVAKVGCGYSMKELAKLQEKLENHWVKCESSILPENIQWTKEKPDFWIEPSNSVILEIKASEIVPSKLYKTSHSLRFARVKSIRYDKPWTECLTFEEFETKRQAAGGKLTTHHVSSLDLCLPPPTMKKSRGVAELGEQFKGTDASKVKVVSNLLQEKEMCVVTGYNKLTKKQVEDKIIRYGGKVVQTPGPNTWWILCEEENLRVKNMMKSRRWDVVRCSWLWPLLTKTSTSIDLKVLPREAFHALSLQNELRISHEYDSFGDHFTVPATLESLRQAMNVAKKTTLDPLTLSEKSDMDLELFGGCNPHSIFRQFVVSPSIDDEDVDGWAVRLALLDFSFQGGTVSSSLSDEVSHVVCSRNPSAAILVNIKMRRRAREDKFHIVTFEWIQASLKSGKALDENRFLL